MTMYTVPKNLVMSTCMNGLDVTKRRKKPSPKKKKSGSNDTSGIDEENYDSPVTDHRSPDVSLDVPDHFDSDSDAGSDTANEESNGQHQTRNRLLNFQKEHPLADSHGIRYVKDNASRIPNFVGKNIPRCDEGDRILLQHNVDSF